MTCNGDSRVSGVKRYLARIGRTRSYDDIFALGILFEEVFSANDPPTFVLHEVKDTVQTVKKGDVGMKKAVKDEMAATDPMKTRQQAFQFIILCISGLIVFLATFFSGLLRGSAQSGRVNLPYFSKFLVAFKSAGDLGDR